MADTTYVDMPDWTAYEAALHQPACAPAVYDPLGFLGDKELRTPSFITGDWSVEYPPAAEQITWHSIKARIPDPIGTALKAAERETFPRQAMRDSAF